MTQEAVTVIVPVWNRRDLLERLLEKLRDQSYPIEEVIVVDNGSEDGSAETAERQGAQVLRMGANTGFSRAVNRGIVACRTEWLAIVNNDVEPAADWLERLMDAASEPQAWFATGKTLNAARRDLIDGTYDALCRGGCPWRVGFGRRDGPEFSEPRRIWFAPATAAIYRRELFDKIGLLDETFESYLEDVDFGLRCACRNYAGVYVPRAVAYHAGSATLGKWHPDVVKRTARNQILLVAKHYPPRLLARYAWSILVAQGLWGVVALRHGAAWPFLRGKVAGLRLFRIVRIRDWERAADPERISLVLSEGEREIRQVQQRTGFDWYWRMYFLLTSGEAN